MRSPRLFAALTLVVGACTGAVSGGGVEPRRERDAAVIDPPSPDASARVDAAATWGNDGGSPIDALPPDAAVGSPRRVFAHYMLSNRDYGGSVDGYVRDIREARAAGIDGFALNLGSWRSSNYQTDMASMFEAARREGPSFVLTLSPDMSGDLTRADIVEMIARYAQHPNHAHRGNALFVSGYGFGGNAPSADLALWSGVKADLAARGIDIFLLPHAWLTGFAHQPTEAQIQAEWDSWWGRVFDGYFYFGAAMLPEYSASDSLLTMGERFAKVTRANGGVYMATVSPQYWGRKQSGGRRYYEYQGGEGLERQWRSIIAKQNSEYVELVTWNDFDEASYLSPIDDVTKHWPYVDVTSNGYYKPHAGMLALTSYFIGWYRAGTAEPPPPSDGMDHLYFAYRTHPANATASADPRGPVSSRYGQVEDVAYVTTVAIAPAELRVGTGGEMVVRAVPAGLHHERVPFRVGAQRYELWRDGRRVLGVEGEPVVANPTLYNFIYTSGAAP